MHGNTDYLSMPKPFFTRLNDYYSNVGSVLRGQGDAAAIFPNPTDIGQGREHLYLDFLSQHLPSGCNIFTGGFLFNLTGEESKQIDIIVTSDNSIQYNFFNRTGDQKSFACIEGTLAVVSIKSTLDSAELKNSLDNFASLPDKEPLGTRCMPLLRIPEYDEWPFKIIFSLKGVSYDALLRTIHDYYEENPDVPMNKRPNLIHIAGMGAIIRVLSETQTTRDGSIIPINTFYPQPDPSDVFSLAYVQQKMQNYILASRFVLFNYLSIVDKLPILHN